MTVIGKPVPVGAAPSALAVTPDGKTVIATVLTAKDGQRVVVIDAVRNQRQRFLKPFGPPIAVSVEPTPRSGGRLLFEVLVRDGPFGPGISFFNLKRMAWIHFTRGRRNSSLLAVTPDGARIYVPGTDRKTGTAFLSEFHFFFTAGRGRCSGGEPSSCVSRACRVDRCVRPRADSHRAPTFDAGHGAR